MRQPLIVSVILNTNRREDTLACLDSLYRGTYGNHRVTVLDNGSTDGSVQAIRKSFPQVDLLQLADNRGYAGNNNIGINAALAQGADWILILNEDTIVHPGCLLELACVGEGDPSIGVVGPLVYHFDEPRVIQSAGGLLGRHWESIHLGQNELDSGQFDRPRPVHWISGCAIMVRRAVVEQVGMLDPRFFYYYEETEWCLRARKAGWQVVHVPGAKLWHKGVSRNYRPGPAVTYYSTRNRLLMMDKHRAPIPSRIAVWMEIARTIVSWSLRPRWRTMHGHREAMWRGALDFLYGRWGQMPC